MEKYAQKAQYKLKSVTEQFCSKPNPLAPNISLALLLTAPLQFL